MVFRCILPKWAQERNSNLKIVREGQFNDEQLKIFNEAGYNIYYLPNSVSDYNKFKTVEGADIDVFNYVFVDCDLKDGIYPDKESFISAIGNFSLPPTKIVDSGNGMHVYWAVSDLDAMTYLKLQRRLIRKFNTDEAVGQIFQLMRVPNTYNTKDPENLKLCEVWDDNTNVYSSEDMDNALPMLTLEDDIYCKQHFDKTYSIDRDEEIDVKVPVKFGDLLAKNAEVKAIFSGNVDDRSKADFRLGHILKAHGFTRVEALSVLANVSKATERAPKHRLNYATNIVDKIWTFDEDGSLDLAENLSSSVREILTGQKGDIKGTRFPCHKWLDNTANGFRLGQVIGLVAGSGVGKTAVALNMFMGFVECNPEYDHFFISLEQPANEIADRWKRMCGENTDLYDKVHVISNYDTDSNFRHLSLTQLQEYIIKFKERTGKKVGCVVIDHIGVLDKEGGDIVSLSEAMKPFAKQTNSLLIMQSQTSREKAGIGDLELNKDAAFGTVFFESFCDYLITIWQPLKRCYKDPVCPTVTAFKFCKIRHKNKNKDVTQEDVPYTMYFDPDTERLQEMTRLQEKQFSHFNTRATNLRKQDRKTDLVVYAAIRTNEGEKQNETTVQA